MPKRRADRSLTLSEAAVASGVSRVTLRRRLDAGAFPNAYQAALEGIGRRDTWRIPVGDLAGAGFVLSNLAGPAVTPTRRTGDLEKRVAELETDVAMWRALAQERERHLEDLRAALRIADAREED